MDPETAQPEPPAERPGCLRTLVWVVWELLKGVVRLGIVVVVYVVAAVAGSAGTVWLAWGHDVEEVITGGLIMSLFFPFALTVGFIAWLIPSWVRTIRDGRDPDTAFAVPKRSDGFLMVLVTLNVSLLCTGMLQPPLLAYLGAGIGAVVFASVIVAIGGRYVAQIWVAIIAGLADG